MHMEELLINQQVWQASFPPNLPTLLRSRLFISSYVYTYTTYNSVRVLESDYTNTYSLYINITERMHASVNVYNRFWKIHTWMVGLKGRIEIEVAQWKWMKKERRKLFTSFLPSGVCWLIQILFSTLVKPQLFNLFLWPYLLST